MVQGEVAPTISDHGPATFVADWSTPPGQVRVKLVPDGWIESRTGGLTVTVVVPGAEVQPATVAVTA